MRTLRRGSRRRGTSVVAVCGDYRGPFRIGAAKFDYVYCLANFVVNDAKLYKCNRGVYDHAGEKYVLWLYKGKGGAWVVSEAEKDVDDPVSLGAFRFRTHETGIRDISLPGQVRWAYWEGHTGTWAGDMVFTTSRLG